MPIFFGAGYEVDATMDMCFDKAHQPPAANVESESDQLENGNSENNINGYNNAAKEGRKPGLVFSFELRPYDRKAAMEAAATNTTGFVMIEVEDVVRTELEIVPPSIKNDPRVKIWTTAISQDQKTLGTLSAVSTTAAAGSDQARLLFVEVWDLVDIDSTNHSREPAARVTLKCAQDVALTNLSVTLSSNGEFVAVFEKPSKETTWKVEDERPDAKRFPVRLFQRSSSTKSSMITTTTIITTSANENKQTVG